MIAASSLVASTMSSPVGELTLVAGDRGLVAILWENDPPQRVPLGTPAKTVGHPVLDQVADELAGYFAGERTSFSVPLDFRGTAFQRQIWAELLAIPYGETRSYGEIAGRLGCPGASRAVGAANGRNPISIIAPCHRVIGATGKLTGFARGLAAKQWLLRHEQAHSALPLFTS